MLVKSQNQVLYSVSKVTGSEKSLCFSSLSEPDIRYIRYVIYVIYVVYVMLYTLCYIRCTRCIR